MKNNWKAAYEVVCKNCGKTVVKANRQTFCSYECRSVFKKIERVEKAETGECPMCGEFGKLPYRAKNIRLCSTDCAKTQFARFKCWRHSPNREDLERLTRQPRKIRPCAQCGTPFKQSSWVSKFCSNKCFDAHRYLHNKKGLVSERREQRYRNMAPCVLCGVGYEQIKTVTQLGSRCHPHKFVVDHITPRAAGGNETPENKRVLCWFCNHARRDIPAVHDDAIAAAGRAFWAKVIVST